MKIKICGITNYDDAKLALDLGADLLGFNFYPSSSRFIEPEEAGAIVKRLPDSAIIVGLFVNTIANRIGRINSICWLDMVQLHGDEDNRLCQDVSRMGLGVIKALRIGAIDDIKRVVEFPNADAVLLDAYHPELYGGTGHTFDWSWLADCSHNVVYLAGGINPDNVSEAASVGTYGLDLCSGVEASPGKKDPEKMKRLFERLGRGHAGT